MSGGVSGTARWPHCWTAPGEPGVHKGGSGWKMQVRGGATMAWTNWVGYTRMLPFGDTLLYQLTRHFIYF